MLLNVVSLFYLSEVKIPDFHLFEFERNCQPDLVPKNWTVRSNTRLSLQGILYSVNVMQSDSGIIIYHEAEIQA